MMRMVHELEVHQIELEMLNEELMQSRDALVLSRKKMADNLKRFTELYDFAPVGYLYFAPDGRILKANLMASKILGVVRSQLLGNHLQNFFSPQSLSLFKALLEAVFIQKKRGSCELMLLAFDSQHPQDQHDPSHTVRLDAVVSNNGQECRIILSDISEQKQTEEALRKSKERYEATIDAAQIGTWDWNVQTGEVIFNNRWFEIVGYSPEELAPVSIQTLIDLLHPDDLIDISCIEAGETKLQSAPTPVNKVLHDLHAFFMPAVNKKKLQLHCTLGLPDTESIIETDNGKLVQILTNLLQNALKFTRTGTIDFGYTRQGTALQFYVTDTGIGIPDVMQEKIFDRFHQVDNTLTRNHEGSCLGLSISKAYAAMLGGKLSVESVEGIGSTFTFTLPYNPVNSPIPSTQPNSSTADRTPSVIPSLNPLSES